MGRAVPERPRSAGKRKHSRPHKGGQHLEPLLVEAAWAAVKADRRLQARSTGWCCARRLRSPAAKKKAIVAVARTLIVVVWHVLTTSKTYTDLGPDYYAHRLEPEKETQRLIAKLHALGHTVTLTPAA